VTFARRISYIFYLQLAISQGGQVEIQRNSKRFPMVYTLFIININILFLVSAIETDLKIKYSPTFGSMKEFNYIVDVSEMGILQSRFREP